MLIDHDTAMRMTGNGPGLDGYAYNAEVYCITCAAAIMRDLEEKFPMDENDFSDSHIVPVPIFFGEHEEAQHCAACDEFLYGGNLDVQY